MSLPQLREFLARMLTGEVPSDSRQTYCMEIWILAKEGLSDLIKTESLNYDASGLNARIRFADGKSYVIRIEEAPARIPTGGTSFGSELEEG